MTGGDFLIALITSQLKKEKLNDVSIKAIEEGDINKIYRLSCMHNVTNLVYDAFIENHVDLPKEALSQFKKEKLRLNLKSQRLIYDANEIFDVLEKECVYFLPLKGIVTKDFYTREDMRFFNDVDILIKKEDEKRVDKILTEKCELKFYKSYQDERTYLTPSGELIETHVDIVDGEKEYAKIFENIFAKCKSKSGSRYRLEMSCEYLAVYNVVHLAKHFMQGGCGVRPLLDAFVIKEQTGYDEKIVKNLLTEIGLDKFYDGVMSLVYCFFDERQYTQDLLVMKDFVLTGGNYGSLGNKALLDSVEKNKGASFFRKAFPSVSYLKGSYKSLEKSAFFYPFCLVHRWFSILFGKRKRLAEKMMAEKESITEEKKQDILSMQDYLGIK